MRLLLNGVLVMLVVATTAVASDKSDFSGDWRINVTKSEFGPYPTPASHKRKVTHAEPSLTITDEIAGGFGEPLSTRTYTTDGRPIGFESLGAKITSAASWTGGSIVFNATGIVDSPAGELTFRYTDTWTLADDGKTLTQTVRVNTPDGEFEVKYVFDRYTAK